jgi:hypothetical protein
MGGEKREEKGRGKIGGVFFCEYTAGTNKYALQVGTNQVLPMYRMYAVLSVPRQPVMARFRVR